MKTLTILVALLLVATPVMAQEADISEKTIAYPGSGISSGDYYQVMFDGEGEAAVLSLLSRTNIGSDVMDTITLEIPGSVDIRYIFQEVPYCQKECINSQVPCLSYRVVCTDWDSSSDTCNSWKETNECEKYGEAVCFEYEDRCWDWRKTYVPVSYETERLSKSNRITITLNQSIETANTGTVLIYYKATGYVNTLINYDFDFETIKSSTDISKARVSIAMDSEMYLRGGGTKTDYISNFNAIETYAKDASSGALSEKTSDALRSQVSNIMYAGNYIKEKNNLDPWESFHVYGTYNYQNLWFLTYIWEIVVVLAIVVVFRIFFWKWTINRIKVAFHGKPMKESNTTEAVKTSKPSGKNNPSEVSPREGRYTRIILVGLFSALATLAVAWLIFNFLTPMTYMFGYPFSFFFGILLLIISGALILLALAGPSIWMWRKYGLMEGTLTFVSTVVWMFVLLFLVALLVTPTNVVIYPYRGYDMAVEAVGSALKIN